MPRLRYEFDDLESAVGNLIESQSSSNLNELKRELNRCFNDSRCIQILYTLNTDKIFFGMRVLPVFKEDTVVAILQSDDPIRLDQYNIEIDSKLFDPLLGLSAKEITAILLHEVGHTTNNALPVEEVRKAVDSYLALNKEMLSISDSIYYKNILAYGIADTVYKVTSMFYHKDEEFHADEFVIKCGYGNELESAMKQIVKKGYLVNKDVNDKFIVLCWTLRLYKNVKMRRIPAIRTIKKCKAITGSQLEKMQLQRVADSLVKIDDSTLMEASNLFKDIKLKGLKGFESDYYEYNIIKNNVTDQDEALLLMRQINTRISILGNVLETEELSEEKRAKWEDMLEKYKVLRDELSKKLVYKDRYIGVMVNYPAIKGLDY